MTAGATEESRASEPQRAAEVIYGSGPMAPQQEAVASEITGQAVESASAENTEITDAKAAKAAAWARHGAEVEQSIASARDRGGNEFSR